MVFFTIARPSDGVTEHAPAEPIDAVVVTLSLDVAVSVRLPPLVRLTPLPIEAKTVSLTIDNAIDAPMPTLPLLLLELFVGVGKAELVVCAVSVAVRTSSPPPALMVADGLIRASVVSLTMLIASEPAMPRLAPPLPEVAPCREAVGRLGGPGVRRLDGQPLSVDGRPLADDRLVDRGVVVDRHRGADRNAGAAPRRARVHRRPVARRGSGGGVR